MRLSPWVEIDSGAGAGQVAADAAGVRAGGLLHARRGRWRRPDRARYDALSALAADSDASAEDAAWEVLLSV